MKRAPSIKRQRAEHRGRTGEWMAEQFMTLQGFALLARRARTPVGEIDLVMKRGDLIAMVEVKTYRDSKRAEEWVTPRQKRRITRAAEHWISQQNRLYSCAIRFDVIVLRPWRAPLHIKNAWSADEV